VSAPIRYRELWDVPRMFLATYRGRTVLFDCPFDEATEDYADSYRVYLMPELSEADLAGSWAELPGRAVAFLGEVSLAQVRFDSTRRKEVDASLLDELLVRAGAASGRPIDLVPPRPVAGW
jgi:hypothetical protein